MIWAQAVIQVFLDILAYREIPESAAFPECPEVLVLLENPECPEVLVLLEYPACLAILDSAEQAVVSACQVIQVFQD